LWQAGFNRVRKASSTLSALEGNKKRTNYLTETIIKEMLDVLTLWDCDISKSSLEETALSSSKDDLFEPSYFIKSIAWVYL
jgi:hypothetical protein